jgi:tetratricopeptide (TPR) repeat protein
MENRGRPHQLEGIAQGKIAVELDPLNPAIYRSIAFNYYLARHYAEAIAASRRGLQAAPNNAFAIGTMGLAYIGLGDNDAARVACDVPNREWDDVLCLVLALHNLGRQPEAQAIFETMKTELGDSVSYQESEIYAQWGDVPRALDALERAFKTRDPGIGWLKVDPLLDPLRKEPRFHEIERKLNFPS